MQPKDKGTKPGPRSGHSITCAQEKAILFGGCGVQDGKSAIFNETYILHIADQFRWELAEVTGDVPSPRWRHTVRCCRGGDSTRPQRARPSGAAACSSPPRVHVHHAQATLLPDNHSILYFGGLCKGKRFNDTHVFDITTREWSLREVRRDAPRAPTGPRAPSPRVLPRPRRPPSPTSPRRRLGRSRARRRTHARTTPPRWSSSTRRRCAGALVRAVAHGAGAGSLIPISDDHSERRGRHIVPYPHAIDVATELLDGIAVSGNMHAQINNDLFCCDASRNTIHII